MHQTQNPYNGTLSNIFKKNNGHFGDNKRWNESENKIYNCIVLSDKYLK